MDFFRVIKRSRKNLAKKGLIKTRHGLLPTPFFMPIATKGAVKAVTPDSLAKLGAKIILANTYHLYLRPGLKVIKKFGGLQNFMKANLPILTDSGGYQVFSLSKFRKITRLGVYFNDHESGAKHLLTPEKSVQIQIDLGSDIIMALDECPPYPCSKKYAKDSKDLTTAWAKRSLCYFKKHRRPGQLIFGIVQGSVYRDLRLDSLKEISQLSFDGLAIGGLAVGEPEEKLWQVIDWLKKHLPKNKPVYLMGMGRPEQIVKSVQNGVDMFDCVIPTRNARHGVIYRFKNRKNLSGPGFYEAMNIKQSKYKAALGKIDDRCGCYTCRNFSMAYLRHLFLTNEPLAFTLASIHNLYFYLELMRLVRKGI